MTDNATQLAMQNPAKKLDGDDMIDGWAYRTKDGRIILIDSIDEDGNCRYRYVSEKEALGRCEHADVDDLCENVVAGFFANHEGERIEPIEAAADAIEKAAFAAMDRMDEATRTREQRRYEIAKDVLAGLVSSGDTYQRYKFDELVKESVLFADALIAAVDEETPDA